ncbi:hypothetical protein F4780DRAFT_182664 [Xylariomycetidae sp. FL0641]|nr:hypothetical protein F4780DRAFT_182664 [Xylariomycetidae sp. FL0641]
MRPPFHHYRHTSGHLKSCPQDKRHNTTPIPWHFRVLDSEHSASLAMASTQSRQVGGSHDLSRAAFRQHHSSPRDSAQVADARGRRDGMPSHSNRSHGMDRTSTRAPETDQANRAHGLHRWMGKTRSQEKAKGKGKLDRSMISISSPMLPRPSEAPPRPARPSFDQSPASLYAPIAELESPRPAPLPPRSKAAYGIPPSHSAPLMPLAPGVPQTPYQPPKIDRRRLGTAGEALGSHPVSRRLHSSSQELPSQRAHSPSAHKSHNRRVVVCPAAAESSVVFREPEPSSDLLTERRRGMVFPGSFSLEQFPPLATYDSDDSAAATVGDRVPMEGPVPQTVPQISLSPPEEGDVQQVDEEDPTLSVADAYKGILKRQQKRMRKAEARAAMCLEEMEMLASLIAQANDLGPADITELVEALKIIIDDREKLSALVPLAITLAQDQRIPLTPEGFEELPAVLQDVLSKRDAAIRAADQHRRARSQLEHELRRYHQERVAARHRYYEDDREQYIRR